VIRKVLPAAMLTRDTEFLINPTGRFVVGGPQGDTGLTGRKIIVDSYGGMGRHGGGAFSGKDPTKVDRSAAYMGRWVRRTSSRRSWRRSAKCSLRYAIGHPDPVSVHIDTFGTTRLPTRRSRARSIACSTSSRRRSSSSSAAPADLLEDDQLRSLRKERQGPHLGSDQQGRAPVAARSKVLGSGLEV
jgi:hypothetical protein